MKNQQWYQPSLDVCKTQNENRVIHFGDIRQRLASRVKQLMLIAAPSLQLAQHITSMNWLRCESLVACAPKY